jgi:hypothetical protein
VTGCGWCEFGRGSSGGIRGGLRSGGNWGFSDKPIVVVEWLALLFQVLAVPGRNNLGPDIGYPNWALTWFSSAPPDKCQYKKQSCPITTMQAPRGLGYIAPTHSWHLH